MEYDMKRVVSMLIVLFVLSFSLSALSLKDGVYKAQDDAFGNGYKNTIEVTVSAGKITSVIWDAIAQDGGTNKIQRSKDGKYGMKEKAGAMAPWWEQAKAIEDYVIKTQSVEQPDAISGASIHLDPFYTLLNKALSKAKK